MPKILIAEDDPTQLQTVRGWVENAFAAEVVEAADGARALYHLTHTPALDLSLVDLRMPVLDGLTMMRRARDLSINCPLMVLSGTDDIGEAVEAMRLGALDFIPKPIEPERLFASVRNALAINTLKRENRRLKRGGSALGFSEIASLSPGLRPLMRWAAKAASCDIPVIITGESGAGKEVLARALHAESGRASGPFVPVNCGALPENLVESALFGHEKGAFTGATARSPGKCREADGGVLFLDEIGELKLEAQVKLLRLLQEGEIEPVGGGKAVQVDVRIISATHRGLEHMVADGAFREDLYYRLRGLPLHIPPLRERPQDILPMARWLLQRISEQNHFPALKLTDAACQWLENHAWPGNIREMQYLLQRVALLNETGELEPGELDRWDGKKPMASRGLSIDLEQTKGRLKTLKQIEQEAIRAALSLHQAHIGKAAAALGIGQSTLYKRMRAS